MKFKHLNKNHEYSIICVGEYNNLTQDYIDLFIDHYNLNIFIFDYETLYNDPDYWTYNNLFRLLKNEIQDLKIDLHKSIFLGHGLGATILNQLANEFQPRGLFLISPIFYLNYINPFTSRIPTYKTDQISFYLDLSKAYYRLKEFYFSREDPHFILRYTNFLEHLNYFETLKAQIGLYETLLFFKKTEKNNLKNNCLILGDKDLVIDLKLTLHLFNKKHHFINDWNYHIFENTSHNAMFERKKHFFKLFDEKVEEWLKIN